MGLFDDSNVRLNVLKQRAYNYRWAEVDDGVIPLTAADPDFPVARSWVCRNSSRPFPMG